MSAPTAAAKRIAVIGGGITGLAAAHRILEIAPATRVTLFEATNRLGGILGTEEGNGFLIEQAADMFITSEPWALSLCERIQFADQLIGTNVANRRAYVLGHGKLYPVPAGFSLMAPSRVWPIVASSLMSIGGKIRMAMEYFVSPKRDDADESLASFARRRLGNEAFERLVQPLVGGIYTADPEKLSMAASLQRFRDMEREHGGLIRAMLAQRKDKKVKPIGSAGVRYDEFVAPRLGMQSLIQTLASRLPDGTIQMNSPIARIAKLDAGGWTVHRESQSDEFDGVIVATPVAKATELVRPIHPRAADELAQITSASASVMVLAYKKSQVARPIPGFGFVVPHGEKRKILAASMTSEKFSGRAPDDSVLMRVFVGGAMQPDLAFLDDAGIETIVRSELREILGVTGEPLFRKFVRWHHAMPQYHVGHCDLVSRIESFMAQIPTLRLAGNAYHGVGIPYCVRSGEQAAENLLRSLSS